MKVIFFLVITLSLVGIVSAASFGYNDLDGPILSLDENITDVINYYNATNNSQYLQGYTPLTLRDYYETYFDGIYCQLTGGNESWNESYANTLYILTGSEGDLNVNSSDYWDDMGTINTTQMEDIGGTLNILETWLSSIFDTFFGSKDTDDLTEGSTNLYDNRSWNQTLATSLYADISVTGGNESWNESYANTLYYGIDNPSSYYNATDFDINDYIDLATVLGFSYYNSSDFDYNDYLLIANWNATNDSYYLTTNPSTFWNDTYATFNKTYADTLYAEKAHTHPAENITTGTFGTGNYVMDTNLTVEKLVLENDASHYIEDNATCILIKGGSSVLEIC